MHRKRLPKVVLGALIAAAALVPLGATYGRGLAEPGPDAQELVSLGTDFTFQGKLADGGSPANGAYDFTFYLYDALAGGSQVGPVQTRGDVAVSGGLFTVNLDFGNVFNGSKYYLEIQVRPGASGGAYNVLSPRQAVNAVPSAVYSSASGSTGALQGVAVSSDAPAAGQVLRFDGSVWSPADLPGGGLAFPLSVTQANANALFTITNSGTGTGSAAIHGKTNSQAGNANAVIGEVTSTSPGGGSAGVRGINNGTGGSGIGVEGSHAGNGWGVYGFAPEGRGVFGSSNDGEGVYGSSSNGTAGLFTSSNIALQVNGPIHVGGSKPAAFQWVVTGASLDCTGNFCTNIDHPSTNNNPDAIVIVTHRYTGYHNAPIGVNYANGKWRIYSEDASTAMSV